MATAAAAMFACCEHTRPVPSGDRASETAGDTALKSAVEAKERELFARIYRSHLEVARMGELTVHKPVPIRASDPIPGRNNVPE